MSDWFAHVRQGNAFEGPFRRRWVRLRHWLRVVLGR